MKVVLDTNALISSTLWAGSANKTLLLLIGKNAKLYTSRAIIEEYSEIVRREFPQVIEKLPQLMGNILSSSTIAEALVRLDVVKADEDDNRIIECAVASQAEFILTYDKHLLKLKEYGGVKILTPENMRRLLNAGKD